MRQRTAERVRRAGKRSGRTVAGLASLLVLAWAASGLAQAVRLEGYYRMPKVKGRPGNWVMLNEWDVWLSKDGTGWTGESWRTATFGWPAGYYRFPPPDKPDVPAGNYSLFLDEPAFWGRPTVVRNVNIPASGSTSMDVEPPTDYVCRFDGGDQNWGDAPWSDWYDVWYQTFMATGTSVTGVTTWLAGTKAQNLRFSIHSDNGNPDVRTWPEIGGRAYEGTETLTDQWVRFRSNEIPTTPGHKYALKWTGQGEEEDHGFAIWRRLDEDGDGLGYANGKAYDKYGNAHGFDLDAVILSDNDGTVVPYCVTQKEGGALAGWAGLWGQQVRAMGTSLAGVSIRYSHPDGNSITGTFTVKSSAPNGPQIGPSKTSDPSSSILLSASWNPGEVPLTPGQLYYIQVGTPGFNPHMFTRPESIDQSLRAYMSGVIQPVGVNLYMQVVEYVNVPPPTIYRDPASFAHTIIIRDELPDDTFTIRNSGGGLLSYTISDNASWLTVDPDDGSSYGETHDIDIDYDTATLAGGSHTGTITISAPGATNTPQYVTVYMTVRPHGPCDFDPPDGDVDLEDFGHLQECLTGAGIMVADPDCPDADVDRDGDVDQDDVIIFRGCLTGGGVPGSPPCTR